mgnify:FL=1
MSTCINRPTFESLAQRIVDGELTAIELLSLQQTTVTQMEKSALLLLAGIKFCETPVGGTWGASETLPVAKTPIIRTYTGVGLASIIIPPSLEYAIAVTGGSINSTGASATEITEDFGLKVSPRVDGQAHPQVTYIVPDGVVVTYSYLPL